jgi:hypothetical protein
MGTQRRSNIRTIGLVVLLVTLCGVVAEDTQAASDLNTVLERAQNYVVAYEEQLGTIIGEETYDQTAIWHGSRLRGMKVETQRRRMSSDFLLTRVAGEWYGVRNVQVVDLKPVTGKRPDFAGILKQSPDAVAEQLDEISRNNRRYNIADFTRTFNVPTFPLTILHRSNFGRFTFEKADETTIGNVMTWEIRFAEVLHPTMIQDLLGNDQPQHGRLWIDPETGKVLKTETLIDAKPGAVSRNATLS